MEILNKEIKDKIVSCLEKSIEASSSEISKKISHNRVTVTKYLEIMRVKGLVESRIVAQAKLWKLAKKGRPKVLIVDDEAHVVNLVKISLAHDFDVREAYSGFEALEIVYLERPDLIVLDLMMPGINGYEICKRLKERSETKDTAILILSAKGELDDKIKAMNLNADGYMTKPFDPLELASRIKIILNRNKNNNLDPVTKLPNELAFSEYKKNKKKLNGFILTLKNFDNFNKEQGYKKAEEILKLTSNLITQKIKEKDFLAHIKTNSFAVVCDKSRGKRGFLELISEFEKMLPYFYDSGEIKGKKLSLKIGSLK